MVRSETKSCHLSEEMTSLLPGELVRNGKKSSPCGEVEFWNTPEVKAWTLTPQEKARLAQATDEVPLGAGDVEREVNCEGNHVTMTKTASPGDESHAENPSSNYGQTRRGLRKWLFLLFLYMGFTSVCATPSCSRVDIPFFHLMLRFQLGDECQEKTNDTIFSATHGVSNDNTLCYELFFLVILPLLMGIVLEEVTRRPGPVQVPPPVPAPQPPRLRM
ncbi:uncharacterized protein LOC131946256 [Physella acuta]|uniref:uncharacterized protein LOC131946256 n=1 Tax=Physella acuta TaxID=109671 RepID=UPI0027DD031E|nr:uncharacterized protein LOC131946256 [Physella acuta]